MYRCRCMTLVLVGLAVTMLSPASAAAGVVYSCGFEPTEGYVPGSLNGQGPWSCSSSSPLTVVQSSVVYSGDQAVRATPNDTYDEYFHWKMGTEGVTTGATHVTVSQHLMVSQTAEADWLLSLGTAADDSAAVVFHYDGGVYVGSGGSLTYAAPWTAGIWYDLTIDLDYTHATFDVELGGGQIANDVAMNSVAPLTWLDIWSDDWIDLNTAYFYYDALVVTVPSTVIGDATGDGQVNAADAAILAQNWGEEIAGGVSVGDFNDDGWVNAADASILAANWTGNGEETGVPEPGTLLLLAGALIALVPRRPAR